jgi:hypothetical protein
MVLEQKRGLDKSEGEIVAKNAEQEGLSNVRAF